MTFLFALLALGVGPAPLEPAAVTFGADREVALTLSVPGAKNIRVVSANGVGAVSPAESLGSGKFRARFTLPKERFPQVALLEVDAEAEGGARTRRWLSLPLIASADLKIATKPGATVTVTIGEKVFGPAIADARGNLKIPAQVPPGSASATVLAVDRAGNRTTQPLDLLARPFPRVVGVLGVDAANPDSPAPLEIFAIEPDGRPLSAGESLRLSAKFGACEAPNAGAEGVFAATYRAPASVTGGRDVLTFGVVGTVATTELEVKLVPGVPARLQLTFSPPGYVAGSGRPSRLRVDSVDAHGNFVGLEKPQLTSDFGTLEAGVDGLVLRAPDDFAGHTQALVRATANGVRGEAALGLIAGPVARADLNFPSKVAAGETAEGELSLRDAFGNRVEHAAVAAGLTTGRAAAIAATSAGYALTLATEPRDPPGDAELQVTADGKEVARTKVSVLHYQRRWAINVGVQGFAQSNLSQWLAGGPRVVLGLRMAQTGFEVVLEGAYAFYAPARAKSLDGDPFEIQLRAFSLAAGARCWIPFGVRTSFHLSLVGGLQSTSSTVFQPGVTDSRTSEVAVGLVFRAAGGIAFHLGFGRVVTQLEYSLAPTGGLIQGNVGGVGLGLGYLASF